MTATCFGAYSCVPSPGRPADRMASAVPTPTGQSVLDCVVANGLCVGCGVRAGVLRETLRMFFTRYGTCDPVLVRQPTDDGWEAASVFLLSGAGCGNVVDDAQTFPEVRADR